MYQQTSTNVHLINRTNSYIPSSTVIENFDVFNIL